METVRKEHNLHPRDRILQIFHVLSSVTFTKLQDLPQHMEKREYTASAASLSAERIGVSVLCTAPRYGGCKSAR